VRRLKFLFLILAWGPASGWGQDPWSFSDPARLQQVADSRAWRALLHDRKSWLRGTRSDVDSRGFFLAEDGARNARAELEATLRVFTDENLARAKHGSMGQAAACAFPARRAFLLETFGSALEKRLVPLDCPDFETWRKGIEARGVSLVYSSAYPNNPASMFGHTFLRLDRSVAAPAATEISKKADLFSYGVNFSASVPDGENPVKYAVWGLFGGYRGRYDLAPYYRKVNEYAFSESRDLWEYRLALSPGEAAQLVRHLWELYSDGFFDYYFLDENCSFQILTALEAVKPEWDLSSGFALSVLPVVTVKRLARTPGAVTAVEYRPSLRNRMERQIESLSSEERRKVREAFLAGEASARLGEISVEALDALVAALAYEKERVGKDEARGGFLRAALLERSRRGKREELEPARNEGERPDSSHRSSRVSFAGGSRRGNAFWRAGLYGFRHDLLDRTPSFNLFSEVRILGFEAEKSETHGLRLETADLLGMASLAPYSLFDPQKSWKVEGGWARIADTPERNAGAWRAAGGYGLGWNTFGKRNLAYALLAGEVEKSGTFDRGFRASPGLDLGWVLNPVPARFFAHLRALGLWDATASLGRRRTRFRLEAEAAYFLTPEWDLRAEARLQSISTGREREELTLGMKTAYRF
jgi:hypothetical protein